MKSLLEDESTWEQASIILHLQKIISTFYKDYLKKLTTTSLYLHSALPMARQMVELTIKQKHGRGRLLKPVKQARKVNQAVFECWAKYWEHMFKIRIANTMVHVVKKTFTTLTKHFVFTSSTYFSSPFLIVWVFLNLIAMANNLS